MLENEIKALTEAVQALTAQMECLIFNMSENGTAKERKLIDKPKADAPVEEKSEPVPMGEAPSRDTLQSKCLSLVREDRSRKEKITAALGKFNAKLIKDIPDDKLNDFAAELDKIAA